MYYVYMLRCRGDVYYTGLTADMRRRLRAHLSGKGAKFTRAHPPQSVAALWCCDGKVTAARIEYAIKKCLTRREKEVLITSPERLCVLLPQLEGLDVRPMDTAGYL